MKKMMFLAIALTLSMNVSGQDILQSQVPQPIVEKFQKSFPKAIDLEWEMDGTLYKAEFEIGLLDHEVWYERSAKVTRHKEDIPSTEIAAAVQTKISSNFAAYRISDSKKITADEGVTYLVELKNGVEEWDVLFDATGNIISKIQD